MKSLLLFLIWPAFAMAQISLTDHTIRMVRVDGADGMSVPTPFYLTGSGVPGTFGGLFTSATNVNNTRVYAYADPADPDVVAFGMKRLSTNTPAYLELPLVNQTGRPLRRLMVTFLVWQVSQNQRATRLRLSHYRDPVTQVITNAASAVTSEEYVASTGGSETVLGTYTKRWLSAEIVFQTPIAADAGVNIGWNFILGEGSAGNAHLAIEEVRLFPDFAQRSISGDAGWRMLAMPVEGVTVSRFGEQFPLQGIPGLGHSLYSPNLYTAYNGTAWQAPTAGSQILGAGKGLIWYRFAGSATVPGVFGHEPQTDVTVPLHADGNRWNLVGNPYLKPISVAALQGDGEFVPVVQVWQDATDESLGSWILSTDPVLGGVIAPWQGFMLQNGAQNAASQLTIPLSAKTSGGTGFFKPQEEDVVRIPIELVRMEGSRGVRHDRGPMIEFERGPAVSVARLTPLDGNAAYGWFNAAGGGRVAVARIDPDSDSAIHMGYDLHLPASGVWRLRWNRLADLPPGWVLRLHDLHDGVETDVTDEDGYGFMHTGGAETVAGRFVFVAKRAATASIRSPERPTTTRVLSAWPNPFNPSTVIGYQLSVIGEIRLTVHDLLGREVAVLADGVHPAGTHQVRFDAAGLSSGIYLVRLQSAGTFTHHLITLLK